MSKDITYIAYPLHGIRITDAYENTDFAMFHRASIVAGTALLKFYDSFPEATRADGDARRRLVHATIENDLAYILVRTFGRSLEEVVDNARDRALEVAATLCLILLIRTSMYESVCLDAQIYSVPGYSRLVFNTHTGMQQYSQGLDTRAYLHTLPDPALPITQRTLREWVDHRSCSALTRAVLDCDKNISLSLQRRMADAAIVLYEALNTTMPEVQLLGAITAIELLVTYKNAGDEREKWGVIARRVKHLIGANQYESFAPLVEMRHKFVHEGKRCQGNDAQHAIRTAVGALLAYSCLTKDHADHNDLAHHLEYTSVIARFKGRRYEAARAISVESKPVWLDMAVFNIVRFCIGARGSWHDAVDRVHAGMTEGEYNCHVQAVTVIAMSAMLHTPADQAYSNVMNALTYEDRAWTSYSAFLAYYHTNQEQIDNKATEAAKLCREFGIGRDLTQDAICGDEGSV